jgi:acetyl coenzyme A synthetase (ADP forming)-like protein
VPYLDKFFEPESVAVIGASRSPEKIGHIILENVKISFQGKIYPINPNAGEILGLEAFPSVLDIEEPIDLAVIAIPAEKVKSVVEECIEKKIKACIIVSSGFSEVGEKELEEELKKTSKGKIRIIGPNCVGNYAKELDTVFLPRIRLKRPLEGSISFITQSGAFGSILLDIIADKGIGVSKFISIGNKIDVEEVELIKYLEKDINTRCIALYLESLSNGQNFIKTARNISKKKPIVVFKAGKTEKGSEAVISHTGVLAGKPEIYSAAFKQAGVIQAKRSEEIFDFSKVLANQPVLKNDKIAIVTDGGGFGIVATDSAIENGLEVPELSAETQKKLQKILPSYGISKNPVDLTGDATSERFQKVLDVVFKDKEIGGVVCIVLMQVPTLTDEIIDILRDSKVYGKPITVCTAGSDYVQERARKLELFGIPVYPTPERAVKAMKVLRDYAKILRRK